MAQMLAGMAHPVRFVLETQQHLQDRQGQQLRVGKLWAYLSIPRSDGHLH
jgi:hypothetical protein